MDILDQRHTPTLEEILEFVQNPLLKDLCGRMERDHKAQCRIEYSQCSFAPGWNVKFKKSGRGLCTVYPGVGRFTVLVVVGQKEKFEAEALLPTCSPELQAIYARTKEGCGQRWLMLELEEDGLLYQDVLALISLRAPKKRP